MLKWGHGIDYSCPRFALHSKKKKSCTCPIYEADDSFEFEQLFLKYIKPLEKGVNDD